MLDPRKLSILKAAADAEAAKRSFKEFVRQYWRVAEPAYRLVPNWHVDAVCDHLEAVARGWIRQLLINIPPGHAKSLIAAVLWPAWVWTWRPQWRVLTTSYADHLATRDARRARAVIESPEYIAAFRTGGEGNSIWSLRDDHNTDHSYENTRSGYREALSVGSKGTGLRGNCVLGDDLLNVSDSYSKVKREAAIEYWDKTMSSRVNEPEKDAFVLIMQRLHEDDPAGHVLRQGGYEHLKLPSEYNPAKSCVTFTTRKGPGGYVHRREFFRDPRTKKDELLFPQVHGAEVIARAKLKLRDDYVGQHNQDPSPPEGGAFKYKWWRFFKLPWSVRDGRPRECVQPDEYPSIQLPDVRSLYWGVSVDAAVKDATKADDPVGIGLWAAQGARYFLVRDLTAKRSYTEMREALVELRDWCAEKGIQVAEWWVEDKANGPAVVDDLRGVLPGIQEVTPDGGKEARAAVATPIVKAGQVFLPEGEGWVQEFVDELAAFPKGSHDDRVDHTSQALRQMVSSDAVRLLESLGMRR